MDIFAGRVGLARGSVSSDIIFVTVWTCVVRCAALLHARLLDVVVVLFSRKHQLVALTEQRRGAAAAQAVVP